MAHTHTLLRSSSSLQAMAAADIPHAETLELFKTVAAVVHLGGAGFASNPSPNPSPNP